MTSGLDDYLKTLDIRDTREKANDSIYDAYTRLADRYAALEKHSTATNVTGKPGDPVPSEGKRLATSTTTGTNNDLARLRNDLTAANRTTATLTTQLTTLQTQYEQLKSTAKAQDGRLRAAQQQVAGLTRKLRDREEELRGKARLVEQVQDEMVGLEMAVNVAEENASRIGRENRDLVERWMKRVGEEAEEMNVGSGWDK